MNLAKTVTTVICTSTSG